MFQHRSSYQVPFVSFFSEDDGKNPPVAPVKPEKPAFDDAQQKAINDMLAAERKTAEERTEQRLKDEGTKREQDAKAEADRKAAEDRGAFDEVKQSLTKERDDAKAAETDLRAKVEKYEALTKTRVDAIKGELPAEATEDFPADADALDQLTWLEGRKTLLAKLTPATTQHPRVPATPAAQGTTKPEATSLVSRHAI